MVCAGLTGFARPVATSRLASSPAPTPAVAPVAHGLPASPSGASVCTAKTTGFYAVQYKITYPAAGSKVGDFDTYPAPDIEVPVAPGFDAVVESATLVGNGPLTLPVNNGYIGAQSWSGSVYSYPGNSGFNDWEGALSIRADYPFSATVLAQVQGATC